MYLFCSFRFRQKGGLSTMQNMQVHTKLFTKLFNLNVLKDRICGVMVSVVASCAVDGGFKPQPNQTNDYEIGICCFSAKHATIRN